MGKVTQSKAVHRTAGIFRILGIIAVAAMMVFVIASCEGPVGPDGAAGKDGAVGKDGADGAKGADGAQGPAGPGANVTFYTVTFVADTDVKGLPTKQTVFENRYADSPPWNKEPYKEITKPTTEGLWVPAEFKGWIKQKASEKGIVYATSGAYEDALFTSELNLFDFYNTPITENTTLVPVWIAQRKLPSAENSGVLQIASAIAEINGPTSYYGNTYFLALTSNKETAGTVLTRDDINLTIEGVGAGTTARTISISDKNALFTLGEKIEDSDNESTKEGKKHKGINLTIGNRITLQGKTDNEFPLISVNDTNERQKKVSSNTFTMLAGSSITGNTNTANLGASAINIAGDGTFNMEGGEITGNTSSKACAVINDGTFKMSGGLISGNTNITTTPATAIDVVFMNSYGNKSSFTLSGTAVIGGIGLMYDDDDHGDTDSDGNLITRLPYQPITVSGWAPGSTVKINLIGMKDDSLIVGSDTEPQKETKRFLAIKNKWNSKTVLKGTFTATNISLGNLVMINDDFAFKAQAITGGSISAAGVVTLP